MQRTWFIYKEDKVSGPHSTEYIQNQIESQQSFDIWSRGLPEWIESSKWKSTVQSPNNKINLELERRYKFRHEGRESEFLPIPQLVAVIRKINNLTYLDVLQEGTSEWQDVFKVEPIIEALGITRRAHARVPIMGTADFEQTELKFRAHVITISEGGMGISDGQGLSIGNKFKAVITSPNLFSVINCFCEVVYVGQDGYTGFRFENISEESRGVIVEYVRKFQDGKKS